MLLVFFPETFIAGSFNVSVNSSAVSLVIQPLSLIDVSIGVEELTLAAGLVKLPLSDVPGAVRPLHVSIAVAETALPGTGVDSARLVGVDTVCQLGGIFVRSMKGLLALVSLEVLRLHLTGQLEDLILLSLEETSYQGLDPLEHIDLVCRFLRALVGLGTILNKKFVRLEFFITDSSYENLPLRNRSRHAWGCW